MIYTVTVVGQIIYLLLLYLAAFYCLGKVVVFLSSQYMKMMYATPAVKAIDFIPIWQAASSATEVDKHFGKPDGWAEDFASRLRGMGAQLKRKAKESKQ